MFGTLTTLGAVFITFLHRQLATFSLKLAQQQQKQTKLTVIAIVTAMIMVQVRASLWHYLNYS